MLDPQRVCGRFLASLQMSPLRFRTYSGQSPSKSPLRARTPTNSPCKTAYNICIKFKDSFPFCQINRLQPIHYRHFDLNYRSN